MYPDNEPIVGGGGGLSTLEHTLKDVYSTLEKSNIIIFDNAHRALKFALMKIEKPECIEFLDKCLQRIVSILVDQNHMRLNNSILKTIDDSLLLSVQILIALKPTPTYFIETTSKLFNKSAIYYAGARTYSWNVNTTGMSQSRVVAINRFNELGGFFIFRDLYLSTDFKWPGADIMLPMIQAIIEMETSLKDDDLVESIVGKVIDDILALTDELRRRENQEYISLIIHAAASHYRLSSDVDKVRQFYHIWKEHTLKLLNSSSLVLKLSGWDQMNELIKEAVSSRPRAQRYRVYNAGSAEVNGIYEMCKVDEDGACWYQKKPDSPGGPLLTLFRCKMRNNARHWFISILDKVKPGTSDDIDFYTFKSDAENDSEPQSYGWMKVGLRGLEPVPLLERLESFLPPNKTIGDFLITSFPQWVNKTDILVSVFGPSSHREIVARSARLVKFLAETGSITKMHLALVWRAVLLNNESEVLEELLSLLATMSLSLETELYAALIDLVLDSLRNDANGVAKAVLFLEKYQRETSGKMEYLRDESVAKLISLAWTVYRSPAFEHVKNHVIIEELLTQCLQTKSGIPITTEFTTACLNELVKLSKSTEEGPVTKVIQTLCFLMMSNTSPEIMSDDAFASFPNIIITEIKRFVVQSRLAYAQGKVDGAFISDGLQRRLKLIRQFYNISIEVKISIDVLSTLFETLTEPVETEEFFRFIKVLTTRSGLADVICDSELAEAIFHTMVCSPSLDWSVCGDLAFECFHSLFMSMANKYHMSRDMSMMGIGTLWSIMQDVSSPASAAQAIELLVRAYVEFDPVEMSILVEAFRLLQLNVSASPKTAANLRHITRLVDLLIFCVSQKKGSSVCAHGASGIMNRICVFVRYKRMSQYYNYNYNNATDRSEKPLEGTITVNTDPMHTVSTLKESISNQLEIYSTKKLSLEYDGCTLNEPSMFLSQLGISDGSDISALIMTSSYTSSYSVDDEDEVLDFDKDDLTVAIANDPDKFFLLCDAIEAIQGLPGGEVVALNVWKLINIIPSHRPAVEAVRDCQGDAYTQWMRTLIASPVKYAYTLQIIDALLQPAPEISSSELFSQAEWFRSAFVAMGGFSTILADFIRPRTSHVLSNSSKWIILHILRYLLLAPSDDLSLASSVFDEVQLYSLEVTQTLLSLAYEAAAVEHLSRVQSALVTIMFLLKSPTVAQQLTSNPHTQKLLLSVLRSSSTRVREIAADFAIQVGRSQAVVFTWLTSELNTLHPITSSNHELFKALMALIEDDECQLPEQHVQDLVDIMSEKLLLFSMDHKKGKDAVIVNQDNLCGFICLLHSLMKTHLVQVSASPFGQVMVSVLFRNYLFVFSEGSQSSAPLCQTPVTKLAAYQVLGLCLRSSPAAFEAVLREVSQLTEAAAGLLRSSWGCTVSSDIKRSPMDYVGLKNQGGTCYMNSLLQQMFMNVSLREAILKTKLRSRDRCTLWHCSDAELVEQAFLFEYQNGSRRLGKVVGFDPLTRLHRIVYPPSAQDGTPLEEVVYKIREGRPGKETGRVMHIRRVNETIDEREEAARYVLEQLQRSFCFLRFSKKRYFDPKPFVDACKTLNLNFNVYHQNDAAEFYDQLLDRLETATKGKITSQNIWNNVIMESVFGGKILYQKIPKECDIYLHEKAECGQVIGAREEPFLKIEITIRGNELIDESLSSLIEGELMDGDNKIMCDVCQEKKAVVRRTCIGKLPNLLVLHLKRFDLDFTTFETVKLNTRMEFETHLNMLKYTKEGIDYEERMRLLAPLEGGEEDDEDADDARDIRRLQYEQEGYVAPDPMDFEYELSGVLVHAGIAQGGHYYSFIKDNDGSEKWFRFEDDEVSPFDSAQIPYQCFGGSFPVNVSAGAHAIDEERTSNALLLFYRKTRSAIVPDALSLVSAGNDAEMLVDGYEAFSAEVCESNERHALFSYILDAGLQPLVREMVVVASMGNLALSDSLCRDVVEHGCTFLLNVVLHFKERAGMQQWISVLSSAFREFPALAAHFVKGLSKPSSWLYTYLFCSDSLSRVTFGELLTEVVSIVAPKAPDALKGFMSFSYIEFEKLTASDNPLALTAACASILKCIMRVLYDAPSRIRSHDELLIIIREFALIPSLRSAMMGESIIEDLIYFVLPDKVSDSVRSKFRTSNAAKVDQSAFATTQNVFEAIAALLGVPQKRKINLLDENSTFWDPLLVPEAKAALETIFSELALLGTIDARTFVGYYEKINGSGNRNIALIVRNIFERCDTTSDGKLTFSGFYKYHADLANTNPKGLWKCFTQFGFANDLTRAASIVPWEPSGTCELSETVRVLLADVALYEAGIDFAEGSAVAIAMRVSWQDRDVSLNLIKDAVARLFEVVADWSSQLAVEAIVNFMKMLLTMDDGLFEARARMLLLSDNGIVNCICDERRMKDIFRASFSTVMERYESALESLVQLPNVLAFMDEGAALNPSLGYARDRMASAQNRNHVSVVPGDRMVGDPELMASVVKVDSAGSFATNGEYIFKEILDDAGWFYRLGVYDGKQVMFSLYRCKMNNDKHQWFISAHKDGSRPGTQLDVDFYSADSMYDNSSVLQYNDRLPPRDGWRPCGNNPEPPPQLTILSDSEVYIDADDTDSCRDDVSLNVGDDEGFEDSFNSAPGSPGNEYSDLMYEK